MKFAIADGTWFVSCATCNLLYRGLLSGLAPHSRQQVFQNVFIIRIRSGTGAFDGSELSFGVTVVTVDGLDDVVGGVGGGFSRVLFSSNLGVFRRRRPLFSVLLA